MGASRCGEDWNIVAVQFREVIEGMFQVWVREAFPIFLLFLLALTYRDLNPEQKSLQFGWIRFSSHY